jgi:hypothetical protein
LFLPRWPQTSSFLNFSFIAIKSKSSVNFVTGRELCTRNIQIESSQTLAIFDDINYKFAMKIKALSSQKQVNLLHNHIKEIIPWPQKCGQLSIKKWNRNKHQELPQILFLFHVHGNHGEHEK